MAKVKDLKAHELNPRKMSMGKRELLKESLTEFGDLGAIVFNKQTGNLVSGHQRTSVLDKDSKIVIEKKFNEPTPQGTIATGYIETGVDRISYREVMWDKKKEVEAMLAANKHSGEWDTENLRVLFADIPTINVDLTGFTINELSMMDIEIPEIDPVFMDDISRISGVMGASPVDTQTDAQYMRDHNGPSESINKEFIGGSSDTTKDNEEFEGDPVIKGKRILIVIDCKTDELKKELRSKIATLIEGTEAIMA